MRDPRASANIQVYGTHRIRLAWGCYHQAPSAGDLDATCGNPTLGLMGSRHFVLGYGLGSEDDRFHLPVETSEGRHRAHAQPLALRRIVKGSSNSSRTEPCYDLEVGMTERILVAGLAVLACLGLLPIIGRLFARRAQGVRTIAQGACCLAVVAASWAALSGRTTSKGASSGELAQPSAQSGQGYVSSKTCRKCHPANYDSWHSSYHRTMTTVASRETVLAPFNNEWVEVQGKKYYLSSDGDNFLIDGTRVALITGSHHMQIFWTQSGRPDSAVRIVPIVYLLEEKRWVPRESAFLRPSSHTLNDGGGRWYVSCIQCHTTFPRPQPLGFRRVRFNTVVAEFGIACEACHGPAERHVQHNAAPLARYQRHLSGDADPTIINPTRLAKDKASQVCGQCHSVRNPRDLGEFLKNGLGYRPGLDMHDSLDLFVEGKADAAFTWPDGMVRVSGREYSGLSRSPCAVRGPVTCMSCHSMHKPASDPRPVEEWANDQLKMGMDGNQACVACHQDIEDRLQAHTHHVPGSTGSLCYNCHMPYTTYGLLKAIRSHEIDSPSVAVELATGRPNACNLCHLDKTLQWTAEKLGQWHAQESVDLTDDQRTIAASVLGILSGDAGQRALVALAMGWQPARDISGDGWMAPLLAPLLEDPYDAVRFVAWRSLRSLPGQHGLTYDFVGPAGDRAAARREATERWAAGQATTSSAATLTCEGGTLDKVTIDRLLGARDDTPVNLVE